MIYTLVTFVIYAQIRQNMRFFVSFFKIKTEIDVKQKLLRFWIIRCRAVVFDDDFTLGFIFQTIKS